MAERRRTFAPVVLLGLASAGLAAVAGHRTWVRWSSQSESDLSLLRLNGDDSATVPLAGALALVLLACWGVVLVTRGRFRRLVAGLGVIVSVAMVVTGVLGLRSATAGLREDLSALGVSAVSTQVEAWFWVYLASAVLSLLAAVLAVRWLPSWPEMGARYDAPGAPPQHDPTDLDLWRALDEGRDPTLTDRRPGDP